MKYKIKVKHQDGSIQDDVMLNIDGVVSIGDELISIHGTSKILKLEIIKEEGEINV